MIGEALLSISPADRSQLVKMIIILEPHGIFGSYCLVEYTYFFKNRPATGIRNGDEAAGRNLPKIIKKTILKCK